MLRLHGKVAIVTGAGGGIGAAICRQFAAEGAALIGIDLDAALLEHTAVGVRASGRDVVTFQADVAEEKTAELAVTCARKEFGRLDVLVTSAVYDLPLAPLTTISLADWRRTMAVNLDFGLGRLEIGDDCLDERISTRRPSWQARAHGRQRNSADRRASPLAQLIQTRPTEG